MYAIRSYYVDFIIEMKELVEDDYLTQTNYLETDIDILGIPVKKAELYISSGRNAAAMVEVITMSLRSKKIGYDPDFEYKQKSKALQEIEDLIQEKNIEKEKIVITSYSIHYTKLYEMSKVSKVVATGMRSLFLRGLQIFLRG